MSLAATGRRRSGFAGLAARGLARFTTPERVVVLDALPTLPMGKPDRTALRERAATLASGR